MHDDTMSPMELRASIERGKAIAATLGRPAKGFRFGDAVRAADMALGRSYALRLALDLAGNPTLTERDAEQWLQSLYKKRH